MASIIKKSLIENLVTKFIDAGVKFDENTYLIGVQHLLPDTAEMIYSMEKMGLKSSNIHLLGKIYSNVDTVVTDLESHGIDVVKSYTSSLGEYYTDQKLNFEFLWKRVREKIPTNKIADVIILDDGALAITSVPAELIQHHRISGVEQTKNGIFLLEEMHELNLSVISAATSAIKYYFESPFITNAALGKIASRVPNLKGKKCGVIGFGAMGSSLARQLKLMGADVIVYDILNLQEMKKYRIAKSIGEIFESCKYVFGCTGRDVFQNIPMDFKYKDGLVLGSLSSGDKEFLSLIRHIKEEGNFKISKIHNDVIWEGPNGSLTIMSKGYPINFDGKSGSGSMTEMQITTALLLSGVVQAYLNKEVNIKKNAKLEMFSPKVQKWILNEWLKSIGDSRKFFDSKLINDSKNDYWFVEKSQGAYYPSSKLEAIFN